MQLNALDWAMVALHGLLTIGVGLSVSQKVGAGGQGFFPSGRSLWWWLPRVGVTR